MKMFVWRFSVWKNLEEGSLSLRLIGSKLPYCNIMSLIATTKLIQQKPLQTKFLDLKYAKIHLQQSPISKIAPRALHLKSA